VKCRENSGRKTGYAYQEVQARADCDTSPADRNGTGEREDDTASLQRGRDSRAELLLLTEEVQ
jgi:hypothetical protein